MWWERLKNFKKHDPMCTLEDHRGNHVEAGLEVLGWQQSKQEQLGGECSGPGGRIGLISGAISGDVKK